MNFFLLQLFSSRKFLSWQEPIDFEQMRNNRTEKLKTNQALLFRQQMRDLFSEEWEPIDFPFCSVGLFSHRRTQNPSFHWKCAHWLRQLARRAWMKNETGNAHCRMPMLWNSWKGGESGRLKVSGRMEVLVSSILVMCTGACGPWNDWKQTR